MKRSVAAEASKAFATATKAQAAKEAVADSVKTLPVRVIILSPRESSTGKGAGETKRGQ